MAAIERPAQRELQVELAPLTLGPVGQALQHLQPLGQVRDRLGHRRARERLLPGLLPVVDRPLGEPRLGAVPGEQLGLRVHRLGEALLQRPDDAGMQLLPLRLEQALVGGVPHQRVLEGVARLRRLAAARTPARPRRAGPARPAAPASGTGETAASSG